MPRINIHEVDNTKPGSRAYSNYSVVVPGFHAPYVTVADEDLCEKVNAIVLQKEIEVTEGTNRVKKTVPMEDADIFGDTGVLEIKTQGDFEKYIGLVKPMRYEEGFKTEYVAKQILETDNDGNPSKIKFYNEENLGGGEIADADFWVIQDKAANTMQFYISASRSQLPANVQTQPYIYSIDGFDVTLFETDIENGVAKARIDADGNRIPISDDILYVKLNIDQEITEAMVSINNGEQKFVEKISYRPDVAIPAHYGNQIAYELLGLGYTVYYVNMGEFYPTKEEGKEKVGLANIFESLKNLGRETFWAELRDKTTYDYRFVLTGFLEDNNGFFDLMKNANFEISKLASWEKPGDDPFAHVRARGDALALIDLDESAIRETIASTANGLGNTTKRTIQAIQKELGRQNFGIYGKYSAVFTPSVTYTNNLKTDFFENSQFPASFHYLACFAKSVFADNYKEWFAVAGFNRGLSSYNISSTAFKLGDLAVQALEPRYLVDGTITPVNVACNVIVHNRGLYYIWGNRTAHTLLKTELVASHFLNIRQLCVTLKKYIYNLCRTFTFDPNSDILWANFKTALTPLLDQMKANQGIRDYLIEKVPTDLKGVLSARVRIVPIEAVEDFEIEVALEDAIGGTTATVTE